MKKTYTVSEGDILMTAAGSVRIDRKTGDTFLATDMDIDDNGNITAPETTENRHLTQHDMLQIVREHTGIAYTSVMMEGESRMTIKELARNWIENADTTPGAITVEQAAEYIGWMDHDTDLPEDLTPEAFAEAWNEIIKEDEKMISVTLSNRDCMFDAGSFETIEEAIAFSKGRGGVYTVHISRGGTMGVSISYDSSTDTFSEYNGWKWVNLKEDEIHI